MLVRMHQSPIDIELLKSLRVFHHDELVPGVKRHFIHRHMGKRHGTVPVDRSEEKPALIRPKNEVYPTLGWLEHAIAQRAGHWNSSKEQGLLTGSPRKEPSANADRLSLIQQVRDVYLGI